MSDEEYEKFEVNDYDLENEFNPNRNRRRPTKNQQIYGGLGGVIASSGDCLTEFTDNKVVTHNLFAFQESGRTTAMGRPVVVVAVDELLSVAVVERHQRRTIQLL